MRDGKRLILNTATLAAVAALAVCILGACEKKPAEPEITRSAVTIIAPIQSETQYHGEATTDPNATKNRNTTAPSSTAPGTTGNGGRQQTPQNDLPPVTFENPAENEAIDNAASSSGTSARDIAEFISVMGYDYDAKQNIFYTSLDNWQRQGNFVAHYDTAAHYINMNYKTIRIDFGPDEGLNWRMQLWKGEYGVFGGCEAGIYTQDPETNNMLYTGVDNEHMLQWESALYLSRDDFKNHTPWFYREWQSHWWLTGFKAGVVDPEEIVMYLHVRMRSATMSNDFEQALLSAGYKKASVGIGPSRKTVEDKLEVDSFARSMNDFYIVWEDLGELNYQQRTN